MHTRSILVYRGCIQSVDMTAAAAKGAGAAVGAAGVKMLVADTKGGWKQVHTKTHPC